MSGTLAVEPRFRTLAQLARAQAQTYGSKVALTLGSRSTTYEELDDRSSRAAASLLAGGIRREDRIAYFGKNTDIYYELLLAAGKIGAVLTPINWRLADPEIAEILQDSAARLIFTTPEFAPRLEQQRVALQLERPLIVVDGMSPQQSYESWRDAGSVVIADDVAPDSVAVQLYTSGTTGTPKGVMLSHAALLVFRSIPPEQQPEWNRWNDDDVSLIVMPQFHIGGTGFGLQTLCAGATGHVVQEFDPGQILELIETARLNKIFTVPAALRMIMRHPRAREVSYARIRTIVYGSSPIPLDLLREAVELFRCRFVQQYGMTEMCGTVVVLPPEDHVPEGSERMRSAGKALAGVDIAILGTDGTHLSCGGIGEVAIRSPTVMRGYWKAPEQTAAVLSSDGWFRTGDAGYLDADGYLFLQDRLKDMIVSGGENVFPAEVENAIWEHPAVREVAVIGVPDEKWGEAVKAIVVLEPGAQADAAALQQWARARIAGYKVPKSVEFVESLPRNHSGKVLRRELRSPFWEGRSRGIN